MTDFFEECVAQALDNLPRIFRDKMDNVGVIVEDFADPESLMSLGIESRWDLLGLYVGVPLNKRSFFSSSGMPDRIYLYRRPILMAAGHHENVPSTIRDVLIHEIGHHFGFDEDELEAMDHN